MKNLRICQTFTETSCKYEWERRMEAWMAAGLLKEKVGGVKIHSKCWMEQKDKEKNKFLTGTELKGFLEDYGSREWKRYENF